MTHDEQIVLKAFARFVYDKTRGDSSPQFSVVFGDPETGEYGVNANPYIDADRAGFSGRMKRPIVSGLTQVQASLVVKLLEEASA